MNNQQEKLLRSRNAELEKELAQKNRDLKIEAALERVRARTMAMQHSEELAETAFILFQQFKELGENPDQATIGIINEEEGVIEYWVTMYGSQINKAFKFSIDEPNVTRKIYEGWKAQQKSLVIDLRGKALYDFTTYRASKGGAAFNPDEKRRVINVAFFSKGLINVQSSEARSAESIRLLERFANVFDGTYTRFLDLKKAEAQAREAQIELALERVRARTMAMQKSGELKDIIQVVYEQFVHLNIPIEHTGFIIDYNTNDDMHIWLADKHEVPFQVTIPYFDCAHWNSFNEAKEKGKDFFANHLTFEEKNRFYQDLFNLIPGVTDEAKEYYFSCPGLAISTVLLDNVGLYIENFSGIPYTDEENNTLMRFGKVFQQTYTRFLDLQKAEAQARESQIQLALERVRARTMAMQHSDELPEAANLLFKQAQELGMPAWSAGYCNWTDNKKAITFWMSSEGVLQSPFSAPTTQDPSFIHMREAAERGETFYVEEVGGEALVKHYEYMHTLPDVGEVLDLIIDAGHPLPTFQIFHLAYFAQGFLLFITYEPVPEAHEIFKRFAAVFEQTYTRFLDLQRAEEQAKESQIQLALERVRARTMAMQKSDELPETSALLFQQVKELGEAAIQNSIAIVNEEAGFVELSTTVHGSYVLHALHVPIDDPYVMAKAVAAWKAKRKSLTLEFKGQELKDYNALRNSFLETKINFPEDLWVVHISFFSKGWLSFSFDKNVSNEIIVAQERFAAVFDQTYTRFLDLQKAEAQSRESQIQLGLERVRAKAMAMQTSEELNELIGTVFSELTKLDFVLTRCLIMIFDPESKASRWWMANSEAPAEPMNYLVQNHKNPAYDAYLKAWKERNLKWRYTLKGKVKRDWDDFLFVDTELTQLPKPVIEGMKAPEQVLLSASFNNFGCLTLVSLEPLSEEHSDIMLRFAKVFDMSYTRFNDLKQAEAQAREAQIELALERVRAKTMAMHTSEHVGDTIATMFDELVKLGIEKTARCGISIIDDNREMDLWRASYNPDGKVDMVIGRIDMTIHPLLKGVYQAWKNNEVMFSYELTGKDQKDYFGALNHSPDYPVQFDFASLPAKQIISAFFFPEGCVYAFTLEPLSADALKLFKRFASVFGLTYRRYLDLQKAEEQAKEAQIQLALERVRARTMAMQKSDELAETAAVLFQQFHALGVSPDRVFIATFREDSSEMECWTTDQAGTRVSNRFVASLRQPSFAKMYKAWKSQKRSFTLVQTGKELSDYISYLGDELGIPFRKDIKIEQRVQNVAFFSKGLIGITTPDVQAPEMISLIERFATVFDLTYTRFNDLKLAEEQAREAKIEASLERVRGKAMAMRNSKDLSITTSMVFAELRNLGINPIRSGVGLITKETRRAKIYSDTSPQTDTDLSLMGEVILSGHPVFEQQYQSWLNQENYFITLGGSELASYYKILSAGLNADLGITGKNHRKEYGYWFMFSEGFLYAWSDKGYTDAEIKILERFKNVIELTFRRYIELQKSEASARDAVREASLDRVRAEIASMRSTDDLERITPLIWNELTILGIPFIRCGVFIMDELEQLIHTHLSTADGKALATFDLQFDAEGIGQNVLSAWRKNQIATIHWSKEEFAAYTMNLVDQGTVKSQERYVTEHPDTSLDLHFLPFLQGMLYVGNTAPLTDDDISLVQSLADAFSTAYARYEDFNKLEAAKQQVDNTLTELKAAQTKLIQSEKMASLGELTAGIAHEIQNPLNFVNNFSEVNQEIIDELEQELRSGNIDVALALAADIKQNEQKINHHGKRADGIVKGMLQHSRSSGGEKQLTDMNTLADEFMRLAYHGLRAKDKSFNAEMTTHFDPDLPKVNAIPQDIGRVLLNLFNNAFYAVNQKSKTAGADYKPEVSVTTSAENGQVIIKVKDNGTGIPDTIKDKIMQPFFTTKPTGEGTGLGLSLTYDMVVKGHGGTIQVNSKEGEFTQFTVSLPIKEA